MSFSIVTGLQIIVALGLLNVWLLRAGSSSEYRGGGAQSLKEEFAEYGLPEWFFYLIGALKLGSAVALLVGIWLPVLVQPAAALVVALMLGAVAMHLKVGDPVKKMLPAAAMLLMSAAIVLF